SRGIIERVEKLESNSPPVGTVMAFAGPWPPPGHSLEQWEKERGWLLCDGRTFELGKFPELDKLYEGTNGKNFGKTKQQTLQIPNLQGRTVFGGYENAE